MSGHLGTVARGKRDLVAQNFVFIKHGWMGINVQNILFHKHENLSMFVATVPLFELHHPLIIADESVFNHKLMSDGCEMTFKVTFLFLLGSVAHTSCKSNAFTGGGDGCSFVTVVVAANLLIKIAFRKQICGNLNSCLLSIQKLTLADTNDECIWCIWCICKH